MYGSMGGMVCLEAEMSEVACLGWVGLEAIFRCWRGL